MNKKRLTIVISSVLGIPFCILSFGFIITHYVVTLPQTVFDDTIFAMFAYILAGLLFIVAIVLFMLFCYYSVIGVIGIWKWLHEGR